MEHDERMQTFPSCSVSIKMGVGGNVERSIATHFTKGSRVANVHERALKTGMC